MRKRAALPIDWLLEQEEPEGTTRAFSALRRGVRKDATPPGFSAHDYVVFLLTIGAELEHSLMVQYLYAAYSLGGPQVPEEHRETVRGWQDAILSIAKEEMGHLLTVQNMLRLLGGPLNLSREDFPWDTKLSPFPFALRPLDQSVLAQYVVAESPKDWGDAATPEEKALIIAQAAAASGQAVNRVGALYSYAIKLLSDETLLPDAAFQGDTLPFQATWDEWGRNYGPVNGKTAPNDADVLIGTAFSRQSAIQALTQLAAQGEAPDIAPSLEEASHFHRFLAIWRAFPTVKNAVRPLAVNPQIAPPELPEEARLETADASASTTTWISDRRSAAWAELFNLRYRMLLTYLSHSFRIAGDGGTQSEASVRGFVVQRTFAEMYNLKTIAHLLVQMPANASGGITRAGPPFAMPYTLNLPQDEPDVWLLHLDLLEASEALAAQLAPSADERESAYLGSLAAIDRKSMQAIDAILRRGGSEQPGSLTGRLGAHHPHGSRA